MKKPITILALCILVPLLLRGQEKNLKTLLSSDIITCETIATNSYKILAGLSFSDLKQSRKIIANWEKECGGLEPILRFRILLDLYEEKPIVQIFDDAVWLRTFRAYRRKMSLVEYGDYGIYENNKGYYGYVPLSSSFDSLTIIIAKEILDKDSLDNTTKLIALYYSNQFEAYDDLFIKENNTLKNSWRKMNLKEYRKKSEGRFFIHPQIGTTAYFGKMSSKTDFSIYGGFKFGFQIKKWRANIDFKINLYHSLDTIAIILENEKLSFEPTYSIQGGGELSRQVWESENERFELIYNIGGAYLGMNTPFKTDNTSSDNDADVIITGIQSFTGLTANWELSNYQNIGLQLNYNYIYFGNDKYLNETINGHGMGLGIIYDF